MWVKMEANKTRLDLFQPRIPSPSRYPGFAKRYLAILHFKVLRNGYLHSSSHCSTKEKYNQYFTCNLGAKLGWSCYCQHVGMLLQFETFAQKKAFGARRASPQYKDICLCTICKEGYQGLPRMEASTSMYANQARKGSSYFMCSTIIIYFKNKALHYQYTIGTTTEAFGNQDVVFPFLQNLYPLLLIIHPKAYTKLED